MSLETIITQMRQFANMTVINYAELGWTLESNQSVCVCVCLKEGVQPETCTEKGVFKQQTILVLFIFQISDTHHHHEWRNPGGSPNVIFFSHRI